MVIQVLETVTKEEERKRERLGSLQPNFSSAWPTGQCPVRQAGPRWTRRSRDLTVTYDYNSPDCPVVHRTVRWCTGLSGEPTVTSANDRPRNLQATRGSSNGRQGAPDCLVCTGQCPVRQRARSCNSNCAWFGRKSRTGHATVAVRCATRQKAGIAFQDCLQRLLAALGL
jgi:hypothetical protein